MGIHWLTILTSWAKVHSGKRSLEIQFCPSGNSQKRQEIPILPLSAFSLLGGTITMLGT